MWVSCTATRAVNVGILHDQDDPPIPGSSLGSGIQYKEGRPLGGVKPWSPEVGGLPKNYKTLPKRRKSILKKPKNYLKTKSLLNVEEKTKGAKITKNGRSVPKGTTTAV